MFVQCVRLSFSYSSSLAVLADVDFTLAEGWTGVVGANGSGKTTLLRLLAGELPPTAGHVVLHPRTARAALCPQLVESVDEDILALARAQASGASRIRGRLLLDPADLSRWPTLSPGERKRWQIGAALAASPEILLLDEPTNHLDAAGRQILRSALCGFRGIGLVVSHDRALLRELTTATLRLTQSRVCLWPCTYDTAQR